MRFAVEERDGYTEVSAQGRLNMVGAPLLKATVADAIESGHRLLVLNLGDTEFMDSSGLGALVGCLKAARQAGGDLRIANVGEQVEMVLKLTSMDRILTPYRHVEDAYKDA
ncbi:STAS domain-containing protein [Sinomonas gamaensis]|jgi:anti-sigma B factor antagonist|uniref:STAS domain-containing protein n=1 Tax=Sinomonas gamaensis TaxID=2565624 RepID=UPI001107E31C|nr:STAS domain-containing protein [Sinomonas gamaensis]HKU12178.1 STAS domain-containing protein [Sinomonas sp.]